VSYVWHPLRVYMHCVYMYIRKSISCAIKFCRRSQMWSASGHTHRTGLRLLGWIVLRGPFHPPFLLSSPSFPFSHPFCLYLPSLSFPGPTPLIQLGIVGRVVSFPLRQGVRSHLFQVYKLPLLSDSVSVAVSVCLSAAWLEPIDNVRATLQSSQRCELRRLRVCYGIYVK